MAWLFVFTYVCAFGLVGSMLFFIPQHPWTVTCHCGTSTQCKHEQRPNFVKQKDAERTYIMLGKKPHAEIFVERENT